MMEKTNNETISEKVTAEKNNKEDRRVRRTRKLLIQALTKLLSEKQISDITVKELAEAADVNRGTFYLYYRDIYDMLEKTENEMFAALNELLQAHQVEDVTIQTQPLLTDLFAFIREHQELCKVLLSPNGDMNFLHRLNLVLYEKVRKAWELSGQKTNINIKEDEFDYHYSFLVFGCAGLIRAWVSRGCPEDNAQMAHIANQLILFGELTG